MISCRAACSNLFIDMLLVGWVLVSLCSSSNSVSAFGAQVVRDYIVYRCVQAWLPFSRQQQYIRSREQYVCMNGKWMGHHSSAVTTDDENIAATTESSRCGSAGCEQADYTTVWTCVYIYIYISALLRSMFEFRCFHFYFYFPHSTVHWWRPVLLLML